MPVREQYLGLDIERETPMPEVIRALDASDGNTSGTATVPLQRHCNRGRPSRLSF